MACQKYINNGEVITVCNNGLSHDIYDFSDSALECKNTTMTLALLFGTMLFFSLSMEKFVYNRERTGGVKLRRSYQWELSLHSGLSKICNCVQNIW